LSAPNLEPSVEPRPNRIKLIDGKWRKTSLPTPGDVRQLPSALVRIPRRKRMWPIHRACAWVLWASAWFSLLPTVVPFKWRASHRFSLNSVSGVSLFTNRRHPVPLRPPVSLGLYTLAKTFIKVKLIKLKPANILPLRVCQCVLIDALYKKSKYSH